MAILLGGIVVLVFSVFLITVLSFVLAGIYSFFSKDYNNIFGFWILFWIVLFFIFVSII
jgi:hypothetical protein